jgi:molybdopterin/thiamine biosynthesis adenylyltransferase
LCRTLQWREGEKPKLTLIDGDAYVGKNAVRQIFSDVGNKAEEQQKLTLRDFPDLEVVAYPEYITDENAFVLINNGDIVLTGVDNHATRKLVSRRCEELRNSVLISGGNELYDGNVQVHVRVDGKNLTPPITYLHPEIQDPEDRNPVEMSCEELAALGSTQLLVTNLEAAVKMLVAFRMVTEFQAGRGSLTFSDIYFDTRTGNSQAFLRKQAAQPRRTT